MRDHSRRVVAITEMLGVADNEIQLNPLYEFCEEHKDFEGGGIGSLTTTGNVLKKKAKLNLAGIPLLT
jgi:pilus assembly protein CpaF